MAERVRICKDCKFFFILENTCRRYPPRTMSVKDGFAIKTDSQFPKVNSHSWCGEYQDRSEKPVDVKSKK